MRRTMHAEVVAGFVTLFQGGKIARSTTEGWFGPWEKPDGSHYEASGEAFYRAVEAHLTEDGEGIGVYPLIAVEGLSGAPEAFVAWWGCVDWDEGEAESFTHARNVHQVLNQLEITSWVERSRSKGYHLWIFFTETVPARTIREGLIGACNVVDAPITEVNPKQLVLTGRRVGNGMRLPYPADRKGSQNEMVDPTVTYSQIPPGSFVAAAMLKRVTPQQWEAAHALYKQSETKPVKRPSYSYTGRRLTGMAEAIRRTGPRTSKDKPHGDRSSTLFGLACAMIRQGYGDGDIFNELKDADEEWGGKFSKRPDGKERLHRMIESARKEAWKDREKFLRTHQPPT